MDYEKKYNEALERAKELLSGNEHSNTIRSYFEHIFPELREGEDERIRKKMVEHFKSKTKETWCDIPVKDILKWLEKKKYDRMKPVYDNQDSFESALEKAWKDYNDSGARTVDGCEDNYVECAHAKGFREGYLLGLEKQEQKPYGQRDECKDCQANYAGSCKGTCEMRRKEQKHAPDDLQKSFEAGQASIVDNPEQYGLCKKPELVQQPPITYTYNSNASRDERLKAALLALLNSDLIKVDLIKVKEGGYFTKQDLIEWVERAPTDKPAWSEEDEKKINFLENLIKHNIPEGVFSKGDGCKGGFVTKSEAIDMLKSLHPQPHWKPSKEQIRILNWAANGMVDKSIAAPEMRAVLRELYEQLKKLM